MVGSGLPFGSPPSQLFFFLSSLPFSSLSSSSRITSNCTAEGKRTHFLLLPDPNRTVVRARSYYLAVLGRPPDHAIDAAVVRFER